MQLWFLIWNFFVVYCSVQCAFCSQKCGCNELKRRKEEEEGAARGGVADHDHSIPRG